MYNFTDYRLLVYSTNSDPDAGATDGKVSQLERLVFSENFVKEEAEEGAGGHSRAKLPCLDQSDKQATFSRHFGQVQSQILCISAKRKRFYKFLLKIFTIVY